jgi:hypothetical protein
MSDDEESLDAQPDDQRPGSCPGLVHNAARLVPASELGPDYEKAWSDWSDDGEEDVWEIATNDGFRN